MIILTPEFDPLFADDGTAFRAKMIQYIEREFADVLGRHRGLLHSDQGLETLAAMYSNESNAASQQRHAAYA